MSFWGAYFWRGLSTEENLRFTIDWANLIVASKFTVFALFYFVFEGNFSSTSPRGAYICRGDLTEGFLRYRFGGLIFGGAYFRNFTVWLHGDLFSLTPCKGIRIPESGKFLVLESGNRENFVGEIWNPGFWNTEYSSRNLESGYWNPAPGESVPYKAEALITDSSTYGRHHKPPFFIQTLYFLHSRKWPAPVTDTFFASRGYIPVPPLFSVCYAG